MFGKASKGIAKAAVAAATVATTSLGGGLAKQYVQAQKLMDTSRNAAASVVRSKPSNKR